jgi:hypothetical protein
MDTQDLIQGGNSAAQDAELYNVLLRASAWADGFAGQRLGAHSVFEQTRTRINRDGTAYLHPSNVPVRSVTGIAFGADFQLLTPLSDLSQTWVEDSRGIVVSMFPMKGAFFGQLEFGSVPNSGRIQLFVQYQYVAGYANTYLTAPATAGDTHITVADPTGFIPPSASLFSTSVNGSVARIWSPGAEEAIAVSPSYVAGANPVVLAAPLASNHATGIQASELPAEVRQAVICYAVALLLREDASQDMPFAGSPGVTARRSAKGGKAGGLVDEAEQMLCPYCRVR